jgi:hypothetical protein
MSGDRPYPGLFSPVEISAGHGHLFHPFMSAGSNWRTGRYGGDLAARCRFLVETCQAVRASAGDDFILAVKLPGDDGIPVMALGRTIDPAEAEGILERGDADRVGLGRSLIVDPAWPIKAREGRARDIRCCAACNACCKAINTGSSIRCSNNPRLGAANEPGGKTRPHAALPSSESFSSIYDFRSVAAQRAGVRFELGVTASVTDVMATSPDEIVLATGSTMTWPASLPRELEAQGLVPALREAVRDLLAATTEGSAIGLQI